MSLMRCAAARGVAIAGVLVCSTPASGWAQGALAFPRYERAAQPGKFLPLVMEYIDPCEILSRAEEQALLDVLSKIDAMVRRVPSLSPPHGAEVTSRTSVTHNGSRCDRRVVWADLTISFFAPSIAGSGNHSGGAIRFIINPGPNVMANVNGPDATDETGPMFKEWPVTGSLGGFPAYGEFSLYGDRTVTVLLEQHGRPYWVPVSRERWIRLQLDTARADLAGALQHADTTESPYRRWLRNQENVRKAREEGLVVLAATDPAAAARVRAELERSDREIEEELRRNEAPHRERVETGLAGLRARVAELEEELASLSAAERATPAFLDGSHAMTPSGLAAPGVRNGRAKLAPNPEFYDHSRPQAVQAIAVQSRTIRPPYLLALQAEVMRTLPWDEIAGLLSAR